MHQRWSTSPSSANAIRERIAAGQIQDRLAKHALGLVEMSATEVQAAQILLKKVIPDLSSVEQQVIEHIPTQEKLLETIQRLTAANPQLMRALVGLQARAARVQREAEVAQEQQDAPQQSTGTGE